MVQFIRIQATAFEALDERYAKRDCEYARKVSGYIFEIAETSKPTFADSPVWQDHQLLRDRALVDIGIAAPGAVQKLGARQNEPRALHQELEDAELGRTEMNFPQSARHLVGRTVELDVAKVQSLRSNLGRGVEPGQGGAGKCNWCAGGLASRGG